MQVIIKVACFFFKKFMSKKNFEIKFVINKNYETHSGIYCSSIATILIKNFYYLESSNNFYQPITYILN